MAIDDEGYVYIIGSTAGTDEKTDYLTLCYAPDGTLKWAETYGGPVGDDDNGSLIALDGKGSVYVSGTSVGSLGEEEIATIKYDALQGNIIWDSRYGDGSPCSASSLVIDPFGNLVLGGIYLDDPGYRVVVIKYCEVPVSVAEGEISLVEHYALCQNFPNPFNPSTAIEFSLPQSAHVTLKVYDILGRQVATLVAEDYPAGTFTAVWDADAMASGVYFYQLTAGSYVETKKMMLIR
jgi:hypothetical protein